MVSFFFRREIQKLLVFISFFFLHNLPAFPLFLAEFKKTFAKIQLLVPYFHFPLSLFFAFLSNDLPSFFVPVEKLGWYAQYFIGCICGCLCVYVRPFSHPPAVPHFVRVTHFRVFAATLLTLPLTLIKISIPLTPLRSYYSFSFLPLSLVFLGFLWLSFSVTHFSCGSFYGTSFFCSSVSFTLMVFVTFWSELNVFVFHSFSFLFFFLFSSRNFIRYLRRDRKSCKWVFVRIRIFQSICRSCICDWWAKSLLA